MILSFGWTTPAVRAFEKDTTRRIWSYRTFETFRKIYEKKETVDAWTQVPRVKGAKPFAKIRLTEPPLYHLLVNGSLFYASEFKKVAIEYHREGFCFFDRNQDLFSEQGRKMLGVPKGETILQNIFRISVFTQTVTVVRFEILEILED